MKILKSSIWEHVKPVGLLAALLFVGAASSNATPIYLEDFNYSTGSLNGDGGWSGSSSSVVDPTLEPYTSGDLQVPLSGNQSSTNGGADFVSLPSAIGTDGTTIYFSILEQVSSTDLSNGFAGFSIQSSDGSDYLYIGQTYGAADYGIQAATSTDTQTAFSNVSVTDEALLVASATFNDGNVTFNLYVNPTTTTLPPTPDASVTEVAGSYDELRLAAVNTDTDGSATLLADAIKIGTNYSDVASAPEPSTTSMLLLTTGLALILFHIRARSRQV
jgi:hypothetical protein